MKEIYEVHIVFDTLTDEPLSVDTFDNYDEALELYQEVSQYEPARLLFVDIEGMTIKELECNY